uniref:Uncharacterized protein n=1 Tax=Glycine max TaxID=3847 RepID=C6T8F7_SOYBN|nr:unknown [Glycine max]
MIDKIGRARRFRTPMSRYNMKQSEQITLISYMSECLHHCMLGMRSVIHHHHHSLLPHHHPIIVLIPIHRKTFHLAQTCLTPLNAPSPNTAILVLPTPPT